MSGDGATMSISGGGGSTVALNVNEPKKKDWTKILGNVAMVVGPILALITAIAATGVIAGLAIGTTLAAGGLIAGVAVAILGALMSYKVACFKGKKSVEGAENEEPTTPAKDGKTT